MAKHFYPTLYQHLATDYQRNLAVTAGAGTGKTEVLTRRIIRIMAKENYCLDRLLVVTFTDKAAVEMKERIYSAIEKELTQTGNKHFQKLKDTFLNNYISTFHGFCAAILREYPIEAGIDPYFRVMDESEKVFFLRRCINRSLKELASDKNNRYIHILSSEFTRTMLINSIFSIIQKREETGSWITGMKEVGRDSYMQKLHAYRDCILREISYKFFKGGQLEQCYRELLAVNPAMPDNDSSLSRKRYQVLKLIPVILNEMEKAVSGAVDSDRISELKAEILVNIRLGGKPSVAWEGEPYEALRGIYTKIKYLLNWYEIDSFEIVESHEETGFELLRALSWVTSFCVDAYYENKAAENYLDFQDLQLKVWHLFRQEKHSHILEDIRQRFQFIMVDEFQDTNDIQWRIIKKVASDMDEKHISPKLFIVGDEKQAIYSFRGGDVSLFSRARQELLLFNQTNSFEIRPFDLHLNEEKNYIKEYKSGISDDSLMRQGEIIFSDNFRSASEPIKFFNLFFRDLLHKEIYEDYDAKPQKLLCSGNKTEGSVELLIVDDNPESTAGDELSDNETVSGIKLSPHSREAILIVEKIREVFTGDDPRYSRVRDNAKKGKPAIAILLNRRTMMKTYEEALRMNSIDFTVVRGRGFFQRQEIVDIGNLIEFILNPLDNKALVAFLRSPAGHVTDEGIYLISKKGTGSSLWEKLCDLHKSNAQNFSKHDRNAIESAYIHLNRWMGLSGRIPLIEFLRMVLDDGGYYVSLCRGSRGQQAVSNIEKLLDYARDISLLEDGELSDFSAWLQDRINYLEEEGEADIDISLGGSVQLMTVHQSKGLEFPMVFVPDFGAGFNLGDRELIHTDLVPEKMTIEGDRINRNEIPEIGINASNPENEWESEPLLIKRIIKKRLNDKLIAEKKRLLYVAATRAMDHLVMVGHTNLSSESAIKRVMFSPLERLTNWMDWLNKILGLSFGITDNQGVLEYINLSGEMMKIPYRKYTSASSLHETETEYRTDFTL
jgi:ATP-dependent helicase/nuclease subunit A